MGQARGSCRTTPADPVTSSILSRTCSQMKLWSHWTRNQITTSWWRSAGSRDLCVTHAIVYCMERGAITWGRTYTSVVLYASLGALWAKARKHQVLITAYSSRGWSFAVRFRTISSHDPALTFLGVFIVWWVSWTYGNDFWFQKL